MLRTSSLLKSKLSVFIIIIGPVPILLGNFWATFGIWSNVLRFYSNLLQFFVFLSNFWVKYIFRAHINHEKVSDFIENFNLLESKVKNAREDCPVYYKMFSNLLNTQSLSCPRFAGLSILKFSPIFVSDTLILSFKLFFKVVLAIVVKNENKVLNWR